MITLNKFSVCFEGNRALNNASVKIKPGERLGIVGESGSGKTMLAMSLMGMVPDGADLSGSINVDGRDMTDATDKSWLEFRARKIAMVFQEPMSALNPLRRVGDTIIEPLLVHEGINKYKARARALELFQEVGIPDPESRLRQFPHELSGGQRQRVLIAVALACNPKILIADEPTSALDANVVLRIIDLLVNLSNSRKMGLVFISHDLQAVSRATNKILVMHNGDIVESGSTSHVLSDPKHSYTKGLLSARPSLSRQLKNNYNNRFRLPTIPEPIPVPRPAKPDLSKLDMKTPLLSVHAIGKSYKLPRRMIFKSPPIITAVKEASLTLRKGETIGIVGESGSGKSTLARLIMGFEKPNSGIVTFEGKDINKISSEKLRRLRQRFQMVFQDPFGSLDPRRNVGWTIAEPLRAIGERHELTERVNEALLQVGLEIADSEKFPHEFSCGQRQRIAIARAIVTRPALLVADEAVSALDVSVQAQILNLLMDIQDDLGLGILFISHDLAVVSSICDKIIVMNNGNILESGTLREVLGSPKNQYTKTLLTAAGGKV
ncbi:MAG: ABC transporter ATP-binding protein [Paracoccaceae bacterium]|nr:ABC transporter ATP-binding protein [Paracoccaceae bacterium]